MRERRIQIERSIWDTPLNDLRSILPYLFHLALTPNAQLLLHTLQLQPPQYLPKLPNALQPPPPPSPQITPKSLLLPLAPLPCGPAPFPAPDPLRPGEMKALFVPFPRETLTNPPTPPPPPVLCAHKGSPHQPLKP